MGRPAATGRPDNPLLHTIDDELDVMAQHLT